MCGRYTLAKPIKTIAQHFAPVQLKTEHGERYNIAPTQNAPVVILSRERRELHSMRWGLIPHWIKDPGEGQPQINARSETVHEKPSFKESFRTRRCLIPADGFIEWKTAGKEKRPHYIFLESREVFAFAGIWSEWKNASSSLKTYSILTTVANSRLAPIHERMPVLLAPVNYDLWLAPDTDFAALRQLFDPFDPEGMGTHEISTAINSYKNDRPDLLNPADPA